MKTQDFLLELGTEELPPKLLLKLSESLKNNIINELEQLNISMSNVIAYATPRRLAITIAELQSKQQDQIIEKKGPSVESPDKAIEGFAKSCGVDISELEKRSLGNKEYYFYKTQETGKSIQSLLPRVIESSINNIPITRAMKWGNLDYSFVRPVHWLVMMLDNEVVPAHIMGLESGNTTRGLRSNKDLLLEIFHANDYHSIMLNKAKIEVDFNKRKEIIRQQVLTVAKTKNAEVVIDELLLDEVCALVEFPRAFSGKFDKRFLTVPEEALISAMKLHQKYFHMVDSKGNLLPFFISVANIESTNLQVVIEGNERVIHPRLADAEFFWNQDKLVRLDQRLGELENVLFMKSLGSMAEKAKRIESLSNYIAGLVGFDADISARAGLLSKSDLMSEMVRVC
jgi:glycyl-tRNA synthetase beta chain